MPRELRTVSGRNRWWTIRSSSREKTQQDDSFANCTNPTMAHLASFQKPNFLAHLAITYDDNNNDDADDDKTAL